MFEKFTFPANALYNIVVKEGGAMCGGCAEIDEGKEFKEKRKDLINKGRWEWHENIETKTS